MKINVIIEGGEYPAIERVTNAIKHGLQEHVGKTEWELKISHQPLEMATAEVVLKASNAR